MMTPEKSPPPYHNRGFMFTGIVQRQVQVQQVHDQGQFRQLKLTVPTELLSQLERGASIAINGTCLTATDFDATAGWVQFDVIDETLQKTNLGALTQGSWVNFERSLSFGREIGGHLVSGHVHGTVAIRAVEKQDLNCRIELELPAAFRPYVLSKGFIAVDGISLTVGDVTDHSFYLHLIPETLSVTTLGKRQSGDLVNIELDQQTITIVDTVERVLAQRG
ncbi:riboflavin synthase subunit alpha [Rheinheimera sp.]|uniref:riboflavin synthase subunit alpha n=1 Tax=Rheinheimera sp. TaxID=1869214 RepID=UPI00307FA210